MDGCINIARHCVRYCRTFYKSRGTSDTGGVSIWQLPCISLNHQLRVYVLTEHDASKLHDTFFLLEKVIEKFKYPFPIATGQYTNANTTPMDPGIITSSSEFGISGR